MKITYRNGTIDDLNELKNLALKSWGQFQSELTDQNWVKLYNSLTDDKTYTELINKSTCIVCTTDTNEIIGMAFLVPNGNATNIYDKSWSYIRFVSVDPEFSGQGIGRKLTIMCIDTAKKNGEEIIALHTLNLWTKQDTFMKV
jgi:ribosomal protein S18 acetylase RimI-like enzyme